MHKRKSKPARKNYERKNRERTIRDEAPCRDCGQKLWRHRRCSTCGLFVWCTDIAESAEFRHVACPPLVPRGGRAVGDRSNTRTTPTQKDES